MIPRSVALVVPALLALHNGEEALTLGAALPRARALLPPAASGWAHQIGPGEYLAALLVVTLMGVAIGAWAYLRPASRAAVWSLLLVQAVLLLNVFSHAATALLLRGYAPGLATAVLLNLPVSLYLFRSASRRPWLSRRELWMLAPAALIVHGPLLLGLLALLVSLGV